MAKIPTKIAKIQKLLGRIGRTAVTEFDFKINHN